jgi:hypothetical protein
LPPRDLGGRQRRVVERRDRPAPEAPGERVRAPFAHQHLDEGPDAPRPPRHSKMKIGAVVAAASDIIDTESQVTTIASASARSPK